MSKDQDKINVEKAQRQIRADNRAPKSPAEKPLKIKGGFDAAIKKIVKAPKPKKQQ